MKNNKVPDSGRIAIELAKSKAKTLLRHLEILFNHCLEQGSKSDIWRTGKVIILVQQKESVKKLKTIDPLRDFQLVKTYYKHYNHTDNLKSKCFQSPEQGSFRSGYSTVEHIQALRKVIEKPMNSICRYSCLLDFHQVFNKNVPY